LALVLRLLSPLQAGLMKCMVPSVLGRRARIRRGERGLRGRSLVIGTPVALLSKFPRGDCDEQSRHCRRVGWLISGLLGLRAFGYGRGARPANRLRITRNSFAARPSRGSGTDRAVPGGTRRFECGWVSVRASRRQGDKVAWPGQRAGRCFNQTHTRIRRRSEPVAGGLSVLGVTPGRRSSAPTRA
jgi:hypothetical protein